MVIGAWPDDAYPLADSLWLVRSGLDRSRFYHRLKKELPAGAALLVAPLTDEPSLWPKFRGMTAGALAWLRSGIQARTSRRGPKFKASPE